MNPSAETLIDRLGLEPLPGEGGYFRETYRALDRVGEKSCSTAIYYLITPDQFSTLHRLPTDEVWHFYMGDPVVQLRLTEGDGQWQELVLGQDVFAQPTQLLQTTVPAGVWQGTCLAAGGKFALLGATMAPGFDFEDLELGDREKLTRQFPHQGSLIRAYTRSKP